MEYAIARVSTKDQSPGLQLVDLKRALCPHDMPGAPWLHPDFKEDKKWRTGMVECRECNMEIHWEKVSTRKPLEERPVTDGVIKKARRGDRITVWKLDRLGRTTVEMLKLFEDLAKREIDFNCLGAAVDTRTAVGQAMLTVMLAFAQMERDINSERTKAGVAFSRQKRAQDGSLGHWGNPGKATTRMLQKARVLLSDEGRSVSSVCRELGLSRTTFYRSFVPRLYRPPHAIDAYVIESDDDEDLPTSDRYGDPETVAGV